MTPSRRGLRSPGLVSGLTGAAASTSEPVGAERGTAPRVELAAPGFSPRRGWPRAVLVTARPRQWVKNALVIAAAGAAGALGHDDVPVRVTLTCLAFCLLSAGIYAVNDCRDVEEDRAHPRKRLRPIAAGELKVPAALALGAIWLVVGLAACFAIRPLLGLVGVAYVALTLSYTILWRQVLVLDIVAVAGGFVLRALAGGVAAPVTISRWFLAVVTATALFVAAGKRQAELVRSAVPGGDPGGRRVIGHYSLRELRVLLAASGGCALFAYGAWALEHLDVDGAPWRQLTVVPFTLCMVRYGTRLRDGDGEAPEETLFTDRWLIVGGTAWLLLFGLSVHATG
jgi:decaprenyl-phosphate phosphoribosyltransferase